MCSSDLVYVSIKPTTTNVLTETQKNLIVREILKQKNAVSITPVIEDPEYINVEVNTSAYYNPRLTTKTSSELKDMVTKVIQDYNTNNLNSFSGVFKHSNISSLIDAAEDSIISNITTIKFHREVAVAYDSLYNYEINIGNPIYCSGVPEQSILSTGFYIAGNDNIVYLEDLPTSTTTKTGVLRMFYYNGDVKTYIKKDRKSTRLNSSH